MSILLSQIAFSLIVLYFNFNEASVTGPFKDIVLPALYSLPMVVFV